MFTWLNASRSPQRTEIGTRAIGDGTLRLPKDGKFDVKLKLADGSEYARPGRVDFTDVRVDPSTGTIEARAVVSNPQGLLRPGQFARVELSGGVRPNAIAVPQRSVLEGPGTKIVLTVDDKGMVTVFFELNGQPRRVKVPDRVHGASAAKARRKADAGSDAQVGAPMPGVVSGVSVAAGQTVRAGDVLLSIEAMKMETALHAERDGTIAEVLVHAGDQIDAKDLLVVYA